MRAVVLLLLLVALVGECHGEAARRHHRHHHRRHRLSLEVGDDDGTGNTETWKDLTFPDDPVEEILDDSEDIGLPNLAKGLLLDDGAISRTADFFDNPDTQTGTFLETMPADWTFAGAQAEIKTGELVPADDAAKVYAASTFLLRVVRISKGDATHAALQLIDAAQSVAWTRKQEVIGGMPGTYKSEVLEGKENCFRVTFSATYQPTLFSSSPIKNQVRVFCVTPKSTSKTDQGAAETEASDWVKKFQSIVWLTSSKALPPRKALLETGHRRHRHHRLHHRMSVGDDWQPTGPGTFDQSLKDALAATDALLALPVNELLKTKRDRIQADLDQSLADLPDSGVYDGPPGGDTTSTQGDDDLANVQGDDTSGQTQPKQKQPWKPNAPWNSNTNINSQKIVLLENGAVSEDAASSDSEFLNYQSQTWSWELEGSLTYQQGILKLYRLPDSVVSLKDWKSMDMKLRVNAVRAYLYADAGSTELTWHNAPNERALIFKAKGIQLNEWKGTWPLSFEDFPLCVACISTDAKAWGSHCTPDVKNVAKWLPAHLHQEVEDGSWEVAHRSFETDYNLITSQVSCLVETMCLADQCRTVPSSLHIHVSIVPPKEVALMQNIAAGAFWLNDMLYLSQTVASRSSFQSNYFSFAPNNVIGDILFNQIPNGYVSFEKQMGGINWGEVKCSMVALRHGPYGHSRLGLEFRGNMEFPLMYGRFASLVGDADFKTLAPQLNPKAKGDKPNVDAVYSYMRLTISILFNLLRGHHKFPVTKVALPFYKTSSTATTKYLTDTVPLFQGQMGASFAPWTQPNKDYYAAMMPIMAPYRRWSMDTILGLYKEMYTTPASSFRRVSSCATWDTCPFKAYSTASKLADLKTGIQYLAPGCSADRVFRRLTMTGFVDFAKIAKSSMVPKTKAITKDSDVPKALTDYEPDAAGFVDTTKLQAAQLAWQKAIYDWLLMSPANNKKSLALTLWPFMQMDTELQASSFWLYL